MISKILIVDDEESIRNIHARLVTFLGLDYELACDGLECLAALRKEKFNLVIMCIKMPKMDGVEALRRIKIEHGQLPVIIVSAILNDSNKSILNEYGAFAVFRKPTDLSSLADSIQQAVSLNPAP
ncbi:MAG: response regulator [Lewinellaceae bacterium]|nr:response regulator [Saprospiraceae bacterium]MCB9338994.1 response regulator [Lewinellaceae bacterium]